MTLFMSRSPETRVVAAACLLLLNFAPAYAQMTPQAPPLGASLAGLLSYAREHNPDLGVRRFEAQAARERIEPAAALPDPRFEVELIRVSKSN